MESLWLNKYLELPIAKRWVKVLHAVKIFDTSLYWILLIFVQKLLQKNLHQQANAIAFSFTLSIFPATIFLFTLIPYIPVDHLDKMIIELFNSIFPKGINSFAADTVEDIVSRPRGDLLSFGFFSALFFATGGVIELMDTFNKNFEYAEQRGYLKKRLIAMGVALIFSSLLFFAVIGLIVGQIALNLLLQYGLLAADYLYYSIVFLRYLLLFFVFLVGISLIYYLAPAAENRWRFFSVGSITATLLIITVTNFFSFYLMYFNTYNKLYGSIGTVIALMIWLYMLAWILLIGFEMNASILGAQITHQEEKQNRARLLENLADAMKAGTRQTPLGNKNFS